MQTGKLFEFHFLPLVVQPSFSLISFEQDVVRPGLANSHMFFKERPLTATFVSIFSLLSFLPVLAFVGLSLFAVVSFTLFALFLTVISSGAVIIALLSILCFALFANFFTSILLTSLIAFCYLFIRLAVLVREGGSTGISQWCSEVTQYVTNPKLEEMPVAEHATIPTESESEGVFVHKDAAERSSHSHDEHDEHDERSTEEDHVKVQG
ncbi:hypothetical protein AMATHDRAFT_143298 [Amanita thiersii Skay4041]|uniref:Uncharacterized protein n=1 Tax=Amanita thiersii Skay4041 TaxID=703135 RepID=A0A2A9NP86_9AGAR|nr:hypothetical protein AMATHDRAFT_143298 [Amanita thiersii Skay4041]